MTIRPGRPWAVEIVYATDLFDEQTARTAIVRLTRVLEAVVAAHAHFAVAGELAADGAKGPGSYSVNFLDALHTVDGDRLAQARVGLDTLTSANETASEGIQA